MLQVTEVPITMASATIFTQRVHLEELAVAEKVVTEAGTRSKALFQSIWALNLFHLHLSHNLRVHMEQW